jgi:hypothetical protein
MKSNQRRLAALARRQYGLVSRRQAQTSGFTDREISMRIESGLWDRMHSGVYRIAGGVGSPLQATLAACLAGGRDAVASHQSAAFLWGIGDPPARPAITVPRTAKPRLRGCDVHRSRDLDPGRIRQRHGIPCTDPLRTLVDLGQVLEPAALDAAVDRGLASRLVTVAGLEAEIGRLARPGRPGVGRLRSALGRRGMIGGPAPSVLESRGASFLQRHQIPVLGAEVRQGPEGEFRVDFLLVPGVIFELDGYVWHFSPEHKQRDEARRRALQLEGNLVLVATWHDVTVDGTRLARDLRQAIASKG